MQIFILSPLFPFIFFHFFFGSELASAKFNCTLLTNFTYAKLRRSQTFLPRIPFLATFLWRDKVDCLLDSAKSPVHHIILFYIIFNSSIISDKRCTMWFLISGLLVPQVSLSGGSWMVHTPMKNQDFNKSSYSSVKNLLISLSWLCNL